MSDVKKNKVNAEVVTSENKEEVTKKRSRRSFDEATQQKLAIIDEKIAGAERYLAELRARREEVANRQPKKRQKSERAQMAELVASLVSEGKSIEEVKQLLGV